MVFEEQQRHVLEEVIVSETGKAPSSWSSSFLFLTFMLAMNDGKVEIITKLREGKGRLADAKEIVRANTERYVGRLATGWRKVQRRRGSG